MRTGWGVAPPRGPSEGDGWGGFEKGMGGGGGQRELLQPMRSLRAGRLCLLPRIAPTSPSRPHSTWLGGCPLMAAQHARLPTRLRAGRPCVPHPQQCPSHLAFFFFKGGPLLMPACCLPCCLPAGRSCGPRSGCSSGSRRAWSLSEGGCCRCYPGGGEWSREQRPQGEEGPLPRGGWLPWGGRGDGRLWAGGGRLCWGERCSPASEAAPLSRRGTKCRTGGRLLNQSFFAAAAAQQAAAWRAQVSPRQAAPRALPGGRAKQMPRECMLCET